MRIDVLALDQVFDLGLAAVLDVEQRRHPPEGGRASAARCAT